MAKSFRVRTEVGKDKNVTFELNQKFDLLEILSLSLTQQEVYTRMCADFGVVVGRVTANNGFGIPNAKVSIFIPLQAEDEDNEVVKFLYPYKEPYEKNEDGVRYNLLSSERNFNCHTPVGSFPTLNSVLTQQEVKYVYDKYYKFTVKTNESGDFMIYGVPTGAQNIVMDVDLSDIGCFSLLPQDFKLKGFPESDFDGPKFRTDSEIDSLPQIINQTKTIDIKPFWGDEEQCRAAITRVDFDLGNSGFKLEPTSVFMGSTAQDTDKDSINRQCRPKRHMGELCSIITQPGIIDCIRYTPFFKDDPQAFPTHNGETYTGAPLGGKVPVLERFYFENGGRVIDNDGAFLVHVPMNLDHVITNEFGDLVLSKDPSKGVPTRSRCRFRIKPEQSRGSARQRRSAAHLVPNIREFNTQSNDDGDWPGIDPRSYTFSINYSDYHGYAQRHLMPGAEDVFYDMTFNRVYTCAQFHDHIKHAGRRQFIGIKEILPEMEQQCATSAMFFPINSAVRRMKFVLYLNDFFISFLGMIYLLINLVVSLLAVILGLILGIVLFIIFAFCSLWCWVYGLTLGLWLGWPFNTFFTVLDLSNYAPTPPQLCGQINLTGFGCGINCMYFGLRIGFVLFSLRQTKYPECEKCSCRPLASGEFDILSQNAPCPDGIPSSGTTTPVAPCPVGNAAGAGGMGIEMKWSHDCCGQGIYPTSPPSETSEDVICCSNTYGFNSEVSSPNTISDGFAAGGCYVKIICFNPACLLENLDMRVLYEWVKREKLSSALCNGIMNYFWENNWVSGFLYQFQFKAKLELTTNGYTAFWNGETYDTYAQDSKYCQKVVYLHPIDNVFYYRSTPFRVTAASTGKFLGDTDGVMSLWFQGGNQSDDLHASGDMDRHILFPTTMTDMGSRNQCIQQVCLDPAYAEECSITDQIGSTTFQNITDLVADIYNLKQDNPNFMKDTMFSRPEKEIGGDVAQALMQNCMLGVFGYETNMSSTICDCQSPESTSLPIPGMEYPPANHVSGTYVNNAVNADWGTMNGGGSDIEWEPLLFTSSTQIMMSGEDLINCATLDLSASSQTVPFYPWVKRNAGVGFGSTFNDWMYTTGDYVDRVAIVPAQGMSIIPGLSLTAPEVYVYNNLPPSSSFQNNMGFDIGFTGSTQFPPLTPNSAPQINFSQPVFYYFGLRPGATSYNTFIRLYVDDDLADTVV